MKVSVNIDKIGSNLDELIQKKLEEGELPSCLGNMTPPLLSRVVNLDDTNIFKPKSSVPEGEVVAKASSILVRVDDLIDNDLEDTDLVLTKEGSDYIERYKERKAQDYVDHVCRCTKCDLIDVCYKLTKNFLMLVKLERLFQE